MKLPCEIASNSVVPVIRALLAKELTESHELKQTEVANLLGITQTAVSKYTHHVRGTGLHIEADEEIKAKITHMAASLASRQLSRTNLVLQICTACELVRRKRLMCPLCQRADPTMEAERCAICLEKAALRQSE